MPFVGPAVHWLSVCKALDPQCRCLARAQKLQLPHIEAYARLVLAKFALQHNTAIAGPISAEQQYIDTGAHSCCAVSAAPQVVKDWFLLSFYDHNPKHLDSSTDLLQII